MSLCAEKATRDSGLPLSPWYEEGKEAARWGADRAAGARAELPNRTITRRDCSSCDDEGRHSSPFSTHLSSLFPVENIKAAVYDESAAKKDGLRRVT